MRRLTLSALLGLAALGITFANPAQAKASWLSEALDHSRVQVTVAPTPSYYPPAYYPPAYYPPTYAQPYVAPVPSYSTYAPVPAVPVYRSAPVCPPAPVYAPRPVERYPFRSDYRAREWHREHYGW